MEEKELTTRALDHGQQRQSSLTHQESRQSSDPKHTSRLRIRAAPLTCTAAEARRRDEPLRTHSHDRDGYSISSEQ